ncbi:excalibur calcium-binding domain-containing protein [Sphingomonas hankyongi]|uniref:Excalibur calcium-binding domain-containing protein n=1 Tax=Sphingomonas hankyongi TaxID=2908209 RepID=A0ABT0S032_9SPHN|nr:excalibur calcium-binding domain-containing protein [Sphingomonas hankyongi]MCL6729181.1 excalibur calcium-binding domain-containing protein [Sphingomonas hankyongi]
MKPLTIFALSAPLLIISLPAEPALAHGGGLNSEGCHNNRKTGDYHCHRGGTSSRSRSSSLVPQKSGAAYHNCTAARAAGAAPVMRGDPGYGPHLDRDNDGIGCE